MSDYFYSSARVRALETALVGTDALARLARAGSVETAYAQLAEYGLTVLRNADGKVRIEETMLSRLRGAYKEIEALTAESDPRAILLWRYQYDCNNLKAAIKGFLREIDPLPMTFDFGTVSAEEICRAVRTKDFSMLPSMLARGAEEALAVFARTKDPQRIDLTLDRACYCAMLDAAEQSGDNFAIRLVKTKIDLINLVTCIRIMRMNRAEAGELLLSEALLEGGTLSIDFIKELFQTEERLLWERLLYSDYKSFAESLGTGISLGAIERAADNTFMATVREARFVACGPEVLIGYLLGVECEVRNLRMILSGLAGGLSAEILTERIRDSYV